MLLTGLSAVGFRVLGEIASSWIRGIEDIVNWLFILINSSFARV